MHSIYNQLSNAQAEINAKWDQDIIPQLMNYIKIPCKSMMFDANWEQHGYIDQAMQLIVDWCKQQPIKDMNVSLFRDKGHSPLLFMDISGQNEGTILLYGHMDKQPEMVGWDDDKGPWNPVLLGDKLYGRGGADDGYAVFCALTAIATLQKRNIPHARCVLLIEASEESGSPDLPHYLKKYANKIGSPDFVIALDSGALNYEQMWSTTSLRGLVSITLQIETLRNGIHSGVGSGVAPSVFAILRELLSRIEDAKTNRILLEDLHVDIPLQRCDQARFAAKMVGDTFYDSIPFYEKTRAVCNCVDEAILNRTWRPSLSVIGLDGMPATANAGNVTLPKLTVKLSFRLAPTTKPEEAAKNIKHVLERDPPHHATVSCHISELGSGWHAPPLSEWLANACHRAGEYFYGKPAAYIGEGGSIPFMGMLGEMYPKAQFLITGVLGPQSNAHGPNEFLHIPMAKKLTGTVAAVIAEHFQQSKK